MSPNLEAVGLWRYTTNSECLVCKMHTAHNKFNKLRERLLDRQGSDERDLNLRSSWVVNLSDRQLSTTEKAVLSKGPRFAVSPKVNAVDIAAPVEAALQTSEASDQAKESARFLCDCNAP